MEAWQLALLAWYGLNLLVGLVGAGVEVAKRSPVEPAAILAEEPMIERPLEIWAFTMPEPGEAWMVRP